MTSRDFCYWLQGYFELNGQQRMSIPPDTAETIRRHLNLVFAHEIDPAAGGPEVQKTLSAIHDGTTAPAPLPVNSAAGVKLRC